jgi:hypothetical protein
MNGAREVNRDSRKSQDLRESQTAVTRGRQYAAEKGRTCPLAEGVRLVRGRVWERAQIKQKGSFCVKMSSPQL